MTLNRNGRVTRWIMAISSVGMFAIPHDANAQQETYGPAEAVLVLPAPDASSQDASSQDTSGTSAEGLRAAIRRAMRVPSASTLDSAAQGGASTPAQSPGAPAQAAAAKPDPFAFADFT